MNRAGAKVGQASRLPSTRKRERESKSAVGFADGGRRDARPTLRSMERELALPQAARSGGRLYSARSRISRSSSVVSSIGLAFMLLAFKAAVTIDGSSLAVIP